MKRLLIFILALTPFIAFMQTGKPNAEAIFKKVQGKLELLKNVSYHHTRETHHFWMHPTKR